ncbi:hypothetical protein HMPREF1869_01847 [Bacteroidales bacterium KA00251]|nr:hypothetical protein HMPREF1869_01847 [Bacteroidales bacterium KA00251]
MSDTSSKIFSSGCIKEALHEKKGNKPPHRRLAPFLLLYIALAKSLLTTINMH